MNRLAMLMALLGMTAAHACLAEEPVSCSSACASEQQACVAQARTGDGIKRVLPSRAEGANPLIRMKQGTLTTGSLRDAAEAGETTRRLASVAGCDTRLQACSRSCAAPAAAGKGDDKAEAKQPAAQAS